MGNIIEGLQDTCMGCNENAVSVTELYCYPCYLDNLSESLKDFEGLDQLWLTKEAN